jgi:AcrR family transcriptional regulator
LVDKFYNVFIIGQNSTDFQEGARLDNARTDRRVVRTRQALTSAFLEELATSGYKRLNVDAVAARANIGRSTFYLHFSGKSQILEVSLAAHFTVLADAVLAYAPPDELDKVIAHFSGNRKLASEVFSGMARAVLMRSLSSLIAERLQVHWPKPRSSSAYLPVELAAMQIADAQLVIIEQWLRRFVSCGSVTIAAALRATTLAMSEALLRCACNKL